MTDNEYRWLAAWVLLLAAAVLLLLFIIVGSADSYRAWCEAQGGHVDSSTSTTVTTVIGANGQPGIGIGSSTVTFCLSADGRILDVR